MVLESNTLDVLFVKDGQQGEDGKILYTWIKYAKDASGTGITDDPNGAIYIGISYNNESSIESNDPTQYAWTKIQGADGKKGEDAYTIFLENENISFATDKNRNPLSEQAYTSGITIMKGAKPVTDFTIGDIAKTQGIAVAKTDTAIAISVVNGNPLPNDSGEIEIPITVGGTVFKKILTWTCAKKGDKGDTGQKGQDGEKFAWNLINNGKGDVKKGFFKNFSSVNATEKYGEITLTSKHHYIGIDLPGFVLNPRQYEVGKKVTWSYDIMYTKWDFPTGSNRQEYWIGQRYTGAPSGETATGQWVGVTSHNLPVVGQNGCELNKWFHVEVTKTIPTPASSNVGYQECINFYNSTDISATVTLRMKNVKLEYGDTATPWSPSQSDIEGKGVVETVQYYLATSQASGVTSSTSGWSTDITTQKLTADKKYLWNCYQTKYSDGTSEPISTPKVIGVYGDKGQTGEDGQDGAGFHWNLLKYSGDLSKQVLGGAGTYTATVESIEDKTTPSGQAEKITYTVQGTGGKFIQTGKYIKEGNIKQGKTYTVSVWCKCSSIKSTGVINAEFLDNKTYVNPTLSTEWQQYVVTGVANKDVTSTSSASAISFYYNDNMSVGDIFYISSPKVEEGDKASPWCTTYEETLAKNLSITPSSQYFKSTDGGKTFTPDTITIKPTIQGEISFGKWQYSIDGGVSFADIVSGQKGLTINNNVLTVSKDSSLYSDAVTMVTFRAVANDSSFYDTCSIAKIYDVSDIGDGRNLLWNSNFAKTDEAITGTTNSWGLHTRGTNLVASIDTSTKHNGFNTLKTVSAANGDKNSSNDLEWFAWGISERTSDNLHSKNQNYTLSFYAKASVTTDFIVRWGYDAYGADTTRTLTTNWQKYEIKLHQATSAYSITIIFKLLTAGTVWFSEFKLEKGSSATGYSTAPEDLQTAILSTKSEISDVSLKVDKNKQAIEQRVEKTTYEQDLTLVKGDISKANEGLNKWRYEIYPKSLFASEYQNKYTMDVFAKNKNLTPSQSVLLDDASLSTGMDYGDSYIAYGLTFIKMSAAKSVTTTLHNDDGASFYVNGKQIISNRGSYTAGVSITFNLTKGWNCLEIVLNEIDGKEGFKFAQTLSKLSECQLMNCYYGTPVARQSHITNQLVQNTTDIDGVSGSVQKVMSTVGGSGKIDEFVNNYSTWKKKIDGIETRVGETYTTKSDFNGLEIGGRNLVKKKQIQDIDSTMLNLDNFLKNGTIEFNVKSTNGGFKFDSYDNYEPNSNYVLSYYFTKTSGTITKFGGFHNGKSNIFTKYTVDGIDYEASVYSTESSTVGTIMNDGNRHRVVVCFTTPSFIKTDDGVNFSYIQPGRGNNNPNFGVKIEELKLEKGNKPTDWTPAPEDVNGKIVNVETIANQTAKKLEWIVKGGDSSSNFTLTDRVADLVAERINFKGLVTFSGLNTDAKNEIGKVAQSKVDGLEVGGRNLALNTSNSYSTAFTSFSGVENTCFGLGQVTCKGIAIGDVVTVHLYIKYTDIVPASGQTARIWIQGSGNITAWGNGEFGPSEHKSISGSGEFEFLYSFTMSSAMYINTYWNCALRTDYIASGSIQYKAFKVEKGNKVTDWTPAPEDYLPQANLVSNWTTNSTWIDGGKIYTGSITADKIATDAIKSRNYISSGGTQGSFLNLSDGSFQSPNLSWDANGNLIAKNANLSGEITATKGTIGKYEITDQWLTTGSGSTCTGIGGNQAFWAGAEDSNSAPFRVGYDGKLTSSNADITGTITATNGKIGRYDITSTYLMTNSGSNASGIGGNQAFWAGAEDSNSAPFRVGYDGVLWAENAVIRGSVETGNLGDEGDTVSIINGHIGIQGTSNNVEIYSTGFKFGIDGDYYLMSVSEGVKCYRNLYATDFIADGWIYNASGGHYTWKDRDDAYISCGDYNGHNVYYYANYHAFYVNKDSGQGMMYINTNGVTSRVGFTKTSDERIKKNFESFDDNIIDAYMNIEPVKYQLKQSSNDNYHFGFKAQHVDKVFSDYGDIYNESFDICTSRPIDPDKAKELYGVDDMTEEYGLRYDELIAPTTYMVQHTYKELESTKDELTKVKQEKADLETRLQAIEAKLGL